jgi:transcriptional regulator with XRE-family HTH domain
MVIKKADRSKQLPQMDTLAARIKWAREQKGWTQEELARAAHTSQQVIAKIENEQTKRPRNIEVIARALEQSPAWLQFGDADIDKLDKESIGIALLWGNLDRADQDAFKQLLINLSAKRKK